MQDSWEVSWTWRYLEFVIGWVDQERKGFLLHLQVQHEGKRNQSMNIPEQSLLGSYDSSLCHLYFCSQEQSLLHLRVDGFVHISWCIACSNWSLLTIARTFPLLLLAQNGVVTSTLDSHTSAFVLSCGGSSGISACLLALSDAVWLPDFFSISLSSTSMLSINSSKVPSSTPRLNLWNVGALANCPWMSGAATKLVCPKDLTMVNVVLVTVLGSCSSPYILLNKALLSSINVSIALVGKEFPVPVQESWLRRITQGRSRITFPPPLSASMHRILGTSRQMKRGVAVYLFMMKYCCSVVLS